MKKYSNDNTSRALRLGAFLLALTVSTVSLTPAFARHGGFFGKAGRALLEAGKAVARGVVERGATITVGPVKITIGPKPRGGHRILTEIAEMDPTLDTIDAFEIISSTDTITERFENTPAWNDIMALVEKFTPAEQTAFYNVLKQFEDAIETHFFHDLPGGKLAPRSIHISSYKIEDHALTLTGYAQLRSRQLPLSMTIPLVK